MDEARPQSRPRARRGSASSSPGTRTSRAMPATELRVREPLSRTLARNVAIAAAVGAGFAIRYHEVAVWLPSSLLALWFSLGGHYVEVLFLNGIRPRLQAVRLVLATSRLVVWFVGGAFLYTCIAITAR